jgi:hypothetical protein
MATKLELHCGVASWHQLFLLGNCECLNDMQMSGNIHMQVIKC